jgi:hypothetical protein
MWIVGRILSMFGKTCGELDDSYYLPKGEGPCVLAPGHYSACKSAWQWSDSLNCHVRMWWVYEDGVIISRAELDRET